MPPYANLCPGCFRDKSTLSICPDCHYDEGQKRGPLVLPHRTLLHHGQFLIGRVLGKPGGFGITYLAYDTRLQTRVAIKEYLPRDQAGRDGDHLTVSAHSSEDQEFFNFGLTQFLSEARTLAQFDHPSVVRVKTFFEENGTGYLVMDYYDGVTLAEHLHQQGGTLPEKIAVGIMVPILDGLREVHAKGILHRDIKPQNIYLTVDKRPILLDFGTARFALGERSRSLSVVLSEGYAPFEQYHRRGEQGAWTDIYACAAVLYHLVTGKVPPPATERKERDELQDPRDFGVSEKLTDTLLRGLMITAKERPGSVREFQAMLLAESAVGAMPPEPLAAKIQTPATPAVSADNTPAQPSEKSRDGLGWKGVGGAIVFGLMVVIGIYNLATDKEESRVRPAESAPELVPAVTQENMPVPPPVSEAPAPRTAPAANFDAGIRAYEAEDYATALAHFRPLAEQGNAVAQYNLGLMYDYGEGVERNFPEAVKWYRQAAEQGNADAQYELGAMYSNGRGVAQNLSEAVNWYRKAADQGDAKAQTNLGWMYANGQGVEKNLPEAVEWYRKAAAQGNAVAQVYLGEMYEYGQGVEKNLPEAVEWYRKAAVQGEPMARKNLERLNNSSQ